MSEPERVFFEVVELVRRLAADGDRLSRRRRRQRRVRRVLRGVLVLLAATFVIIPGLIGAGFALGRHWAFALIAGPIVLVASWSVIGYWMFGRRPAPPQLPRGAELGQLPMQTGEWLEQERGRLPAPAQARVDAIALRIEALEPQLRGMQAEADGAADVRRLLGEELPELVHGYHKVPRALAQQPLYGGSSPERQLLDGLETIDKQLARLHERLAKNDLHALAAHQRYLALKYERDEDGK